MKYPGVDTLKSYLPFSSLTPGRIFFSYYHFLRDDRTHSKNWESTAD